MFKFKKASNSIEKQYFVMCEAVAYEIVNSRNSDRYKLARDTVEKTMGAIKNRSFLSDFEKTVRDYFRGQGSQLDNRQLLNDIIIFF